MKTPNEQWPDDPQERFDARRQELEREIASFHEGIVERLHTWLAELEGKRFESKEDALNMIHEVTNLVRCAGRRLLFDGQPVTLAAVCGKRQKKPSIQIRAREDGKAVIARDSVHWPLLTTARADFVEKS